MAPYPVDATRPPRPGAAARPQSGPSPASPTTPAAPPLRVAPGTRRTWGEDEYRIEGALFASERRPMGSHRPRLRGTVDARGAFVAIVAVVVLALAFTPWFSAQVVGANAPTVGPERFLTLLDVGLGGWRILVPVVAAVTTVTGVANSALRAGDPGALTVFVLLRFFTLAMVGVVVAALVFHTPNLPALPAGAQTLVSVRWTAWASVGLAGVAFVGSLASASKNR